MDVEMTGAALVRGDEAEVLRSPTDLIRLLVTDQGDVQVADITSTDRVGPPVHTQEWHEVEYVIDGEVEFWLDGVVAPARGRWASRSCPPASRTPSGSRRARRGSSW